MSFGPTGSLPTASAPFFVILVVPGAAINFTAAREVFTFTAANANFTFTLKGAA